MDELTKMIASAVVAYIVPKALGDIGKTFTPTGSSDRSLPWVQWLIACFIGGNALAWGVAAILLPLLVEPIGSAFGFVLGWIIGWGIIATIGAALLLLPLARLDPQTKQA